MPATQIERLPTLLKRRGASRSKHYADIAAGTWTRPVKLGARASGWPDYETEALIGARIAGKTDDEIRELVKKLEAVRKHAADGIEVPQ